MAASQQDLLEQEDARALLDDLLRASRLYKSGREYGDLLDFVVKLRNVAPFNAMLLNIQKPGITHVASAFEWRTRFGRTIKPFARPLLILWPFAPVVTVYDIQDTEGQDLPETVYSFPLRGNLPESKMSEFTRRLARRGIFCVLFDGGDANAGQVMAKRRALKRGEKPHYEVALNGNHSPGGRFVTLLHELAHVFLGHLGRDVTLGTPDRAHLSLKVRELEAESVAYIVAHRCGIEPRSDKYLSNYVSSSDSSDDIELFQVTRSAGQVELLLGLAQNTRFEQRRRRPPGST